MSADEASHWDTLHAGWNVDRVNHSEIYSDHGKHTNMVESFFSRLRRMVEGQHHDVSAQYLHQYANHAAWLEDNRRTDNGTLAAMVVSNAMGRAVSAGLERVLAAGCLRKAVDLPHQESYVLSVVLGEFSHALCDRELVRLLLTLRALVSRKMRLHQSS